MAKILVIDDSDIVRSSLEASLVEAGHIVLQAKDGWEGETVYKENPDVNIIICDVNMPRRTGMELLESLSTEGVLKATWFFLTSEVRPEMRKKAQRLGARAWVTKPVKPELLLNAIGMVSAEVVRSA